MADDALADAFATLRAAADGNAPTLSSEQAQALHAAVWDARAKATRLETQLELSRKRNKALTGECDALVGQVVAEEARAVRAETLAARALAILRAVVGADTFREVRPRAAKLVDEVDGKEPGA